MLRQIAGAALMTLALAAPAAPEAAPAFDLDAARADGALVARALALGEAGDWIAAEAAVAGRGDPLLADIVLWRRLRAGAGSVAAWQAFAERRSDWPGQEVLARVVLGSVPDDRPAPPLAGRAARNWHAFDAAWDRRDYAAAARLLDEITVDPAGLGRPERWADRRRSLVRRLVREGVPDRAYRLASRHHTTAEAGYAHADLEWLSGWIALTRLDRPRDAAAHFERFAAAVGTPISIGRAGYWAGRAHAAAGNTAEARRWYALGARYQTSFYGQLAAAEIDAPGDARIATETLPDWRRIPALRRDAVRMSTILHFAGERSLSWQSFLHLAEETGGVAPMAGLADLALELERQPLAIRIAKTAARRGVVLPPAYFPLHPLADYADRIEPALAMAIARQETELNPVAVSHAGARGLMQLMPGTARRVADWTGEPYDRARLTSDWRYNARLGQTYLARRIEQYGGSYILAAAAYNAGAHRVDRWIRELGDPRAPGVDPVDWIERIPFNETRNYVQRVMEALWIYRTRIAGRAGPMTLPGDLARGR